MNHIFDAERHVLRICDGFQSRQIHVCRSFLCQKLFQFYEKLFRKNQIFCRRKPDFEGEKKSISLRKWADSQKQTEKLNSCANESEAPAFNKYY